jgi:hypothetical protein
MRGEGLRILAEVPGFRRVEDQNGATDVLLKVPVSRVVAGAKPTNNIVWGKPINGIVARRVCVLSYYIVGPVDDLLDPGCIGKHVARKGCRGESCDEIANLCRPPNAGFACRKRKPPLLRARGSSIVVSQYVSVETIHGLYPSIRFPAHQFHHFYQPFTRVVIIRDVANEFLAASNDVQPVGALPPIIPAMVSQPGTSEPKWDSPQTDRSTRNR